MAIPHEAAMAIWYRALEVEIGVCLKVENPKMFREELNAARRAEKDPKLDTLMTALIDDEVWIVKKATEL